MNDTDFENICRDLPHCCCDDVVQREIKKKPYIHVNDDLTYETKQSEQQQTPQLGVLPMISGLTI